MNIVGSISFVGVPVLMENLILIGLLGCNFVYYTVDQKSLILYLWQAPIVYTFFIFRATKQSKFQQPSINLQAHYRTDFVFIIMTSAWGVDLGIYNSYTYRLMVTVSRSTHTTSGGGSYRSKYLESIPETKGKQVLWFNILNNEQIHQNICW